MALTAGFLSSYQSINFSIIDRVLGEADKSEETINVKLWRKPSTANHGAGKHSIPQFYHGKKTATTWLLRGARPLILAWSELIFYIYVRKLWWMWFGRSFATLIALYWFRKNLLSIFTAVLGWFLHLERPWFYFCVMSRNSSESSAISIAYNSLKLNKITSVVYIRTVFILLVCFTHKFVELGSCWGRKDANAQIPKPGDWFFYLVCVNN